MNITIKTIPHPEQRYPTVGDWWFDAEGNLEIRVSRLGDWRFESLVAFHELAEVLICKACGIPQAAVDEFDQRFEADRAAGKRGPDEEPGDHPDAPYHAAHALAEGLERALAFALFVKWSEYDALVGSL